MTGSSDESDTPAGGTSSGQEGSPEEAGAPSGGEGSDEGAAAGEGGGGLPSDAPFPPVNLSAPQLTLRAILTGMILGAPLSVANIYAGLQVGWNFNMSIAAVLLSYGFWQGMHRAAGTRPWGIHENVINQTTASSAAFIAGAGLVAPIPALAILTGTTLSWPLLSLWCFAVSLVGILVAVGLRRQMLVGDRLPFPPGVATAQILKEMYGRGREATARLTALLAAALFAAVTKVVTTITGFSSLALPFSYTPRPESAVAAAGATSVSARNLTFAFDPNFLMVGLGAIMGLRAGISMLLGAVLAWGLFGPWLLARGWAEPGAADAVWFQEILEWLVWPGVALMVSAALTSFALSWRSVVAGLRGSAKISSDSTGAAPPADAAHEVPRRWFLGGLAIALVVATIFQVSLFGIALWVAMIAVLLTFFLAVVAGRVTGETGITPIGAMGQLTQFIFGVISPGSPSANLMSANVAGGAANQCGDMLSDLKTGALLGVSPRFQALSQLFGVLVGSMAGAAAYLLLISEPAEQLMTEEWPAPAVATWTAVAELFSVGLEAMPPGSLVALAVAGALGALLAVLDKKVPEGRKHLVPSAAAIGLAFVIPASFSLAMFFGAFAAYIAARIRPGWAARFVVVLAAGLIAGETLTGVTIEAAVRPLWEWMA